MSNDDCHHGAMETKRDRTVRMVAKDAAIADYMRRAFEAQGHQVEMIGADEMLERMERASVTPALGGIFSKPIKILEDDGRIIASLTIEDEKERPA